MQDNMLLIKEINMQRGHNKAAKRELEAQVTGAASIAKDCRLSLRNLPCRELACAKLHGSMRTIELHSN